MHPAARLAVATVRVCAPDRRRCACMGLSIPSMSDGTPGSVVDPHTATIPSAMARDDADMLIMHWFGM